MAHHNFHGKAIAVKQVDSATLTYDAATTYTITVGAGNNVASVSAVGNTDLATTCSDLADAVNNSTHPYFSAIIATSTSTTVVLTAKYLGFPFEYDVSKTGGTGTIAKDGQTTASAGPHHWDTADNFDSGSVPASTDTVSIANTSIDILFGLNQSAVTVAKLTKKASHTGKIGLDTASFLVSEGIPDDTAREYRDTYLQIGWDEAVLGEKEGQKNVVDSSRVKLHNPKAGVSLTYIHNTGETASETGMPAYRLKFSNIGADVQIRGGKGGIGFGVDEPNEANTMGEILITKAADSTTRVIVGDATTFDKFESYAGEHRILGALNASNECIVHAGIVWTEGESANGVAVLTVNGGTCYANHTKTTGDDSTTVNLNGGTIDTTQSERARTWTTVNIAKGAKLKRNTSVLTIGTLNLPAGTHELSVS